MMIKPIPVTVCHNSGLAEFIIKNQSGDQSFEQKFIIFIQKFMKNSSIFSEFTQELYYMMLYEIPLVVCFNSVPIQCYPML